MRLKLINEDKELRPLRDSQLRRQAIIYKSKMLAVSETSGKLSMNVLMNWRLSFSTFILPVFLSNEDDDLHIYKWKDIA